MAEEKIVKYIIRKLVTTKNGDSFYVYYRHGSLPLEGHNAVFTTDEPKAVKFADLKIAAERNQNLGGEIVEYYE